MECGVALTHYITHYSHITSLTANLTENNKGKTASLICFSQILSGLKTESVNTLVCHSLPRPFVTGSDNIFTSPVSALLCVRGNTRLKDINDHVKFQQPCWCNCRKSVGRTLALALSPRQKFPRQRHRSWFMYRCNSCQNSQQTQVIFELMLFVIFSIYYGRIPGQYNYKESTGQQWHLLEFTSSAKTS